MELVEAKVIEKCDICGAAMEGHPRCEACGILTGGSHWGHPCSYQEHEICEHCMGDWETLDKVVGRKTTWDEFLHPRLPGGQKWYEVK